LSFLLVDPAAAPFFRPSIGFSRPTESSRQLDWPAEPLEAINRFESRPDDAHGDWHPALESF
jgi:hypothetical protein